jgi:hypothetical protein
MSTKDEQMAADSQAVAVVATGDRLPALELVNPLTGEMMNLADIKTVQEAIAELPFNVLSTDGVESVIDRPVIVWGCFKRLESSFPKTPEELARNHQANVFGLWVVSGEDDPEQRFLITAGGVLHDLWTNLEGIMPCRGTVTEVKGGKYGRYYHFS